MPFTYTIEPELQMIRTIGEGRVALGDLQRHMETVIEDPLFRPGMNTIADMRSAQIEMSLADAPDLIRLFIQQAKIRKRGRWAVIINRYPEVHMVRFFVTFMEHLPFKMNVFDNNADAVSWLRRTESEPMKHPE